MTLRTHRGRLQRNMELALRNPEAQKGKGEDGGRRKRQEGQKAEDPTRPNEITAPYRESP